MYNCISRDLYRAVPGRCPLLPVLPQRSRMPSYQAPCNIRPHALNQACTQYQVNELHLSTRVLILDVEFLVRTERYDTTSSFLFDIFRYFPPTLSPNHSISRLSINGRGHQESKIRKTTRGRLFSF